jgi:hypothetical protein
MNANGICMTSAGCFFLVGLLAGAWKYLQIRRSTAAQASRYVDLAHRASLMYAFANALLLQFLERSRWSAEVNGIAAIVLEVFFGVSVLGYVIHGALGDTDNQFQKPHRMGRRTIPAPIMTLFMLSLIGAEVAAFGVIFAGYLLS